MASKRCKKCGGQISTQAKACPHCGSRDPLGRRKAGAIGCGVILCVILAFVGVVVGIVAVTPEKKPPLPYKLGEEFDLPPYKWQLDAVVEASAGGTLDQAKLEALARYIAAWKQDTLGKVERWWISYYLPGSGDRGPVALVKWEKGKLEFQWVPMNYPPGFKGPAMEQGK